MILFDGTTDGNVLFRRLCLLSNNAQCGATTTSFSTGLTIEWE
jgi:hypothetical protein